MRFTLRPYRRFPVQCSVTYNAGPFQGQGTVWNLSCTGWRLSGDLPMRPGETRMARACLASIRMRKQWQSIRCRSRPHFTNQTQYICEKRRETDSGTAE